MQRSLNDFSMPRAVLPAPWLLAGLVACCIVPRALMACKLDTICRDGVFYIELAEALEHGDFATGLGKLRLSVYPPVLAALHYVGLDWQTAGKWWGVGIASVTVLPLFGWVRRQFDDRLAAITCLLYAIHPKLIEWSPELVREATFWFFWTLSLYFGWRAATGFRRTWYLAAGTAITMALHTRFEGWCLYLPLAWWSVGCALARRNRLRAVAARVGLSLAVCPMLIVLVNVTWLAGETRWELGNFSRLEYVALWLRATTGRTADGAQGTIPAEPPKLPAVSSPALAAAAIETTPPAMPMTLAGDTAATERLSNGRLLISFGNALRRGIGGLFGLLWLIGFFAAPRIWFQRDQVVLFLVAALVMAGIWIHLWYAQATSSRYFLTLVLIAAPCAASGAQRLAQFLKSPRLVGRWGRTLTDSDSSSGYRLALAATLLSLTVGGMLEALADRHGERRRQAALGHWLLNEYGPGRRLLTTSEMGILAFYARGSAVSVSPQLDAGPRLLSSWRPDLAIFSQRGTSRRQLREIVEVATRFGYKPLDHGRLPPHYDWTDLVVLER
jgi:hypothetical protein